MRSAPLKPHRAASNVPLGLAVLVVVVLAHAAMTVSAFHPMPGDTASFAHGERSQGAMEMLSVSGCPNDSTPKRSTSACPTSGAVTLTIRGRGFPRNGIASVRLINAKDRRAQLSCDAVRHSALLPTLLLFCNLPHGFEGASYHLRLTTVHGMALMLRNAVFYTAKEIIRDDSTQSQSAGEGVAGGAASGGSGGNWGDYESLGIGGLKVQLEELFRRAFSSRLSANSPIAAQIGIRHIKGVILHGPPGTGKTLIARKVSKLLNAKSVQLVSGPEIMSKFVGESEKNLRGLFAAAEADAEKNPDSPGLHVIIMDEVDAVMRPRGAGDDSGARAVYDGVTTQMLAYMDGLKALNNLLIIGLTNRLGSMDKALLRPGRFEVQIRVPLPDDQGRQEIFGIHTKKLKDNKYLSPSVAVASLARRTVALSGADIEGIVRSAVSFAFDRHQRQTARHRKDSSAAGDTAAAPSDAPKFQVEEADFIRGITEVIATKGSSINTAPFLERGVVVYNSGLQASLDRLSKFAREMRETNTLKRLRVVIEGPPRTGTTALAALLARNSRFAYVNIITPESLIGLNAGQRIAVITSAFDDAANVAHACIVLDRIESIIEYNHAQNRVNPVIAQELSVLLERNPSLVPYQQDSRLLVIITTSAPEAMKVLTPGGQYDAKEAVRPLSHSDVVVVLTAYEVFQDTAAAVEAARLLPAAIGVKQLLFLIDVARSRAGVSAGKAPKHADDAASLSDSVPPVPDDDDSNASPSPLSTDDNRFITVEGFKEVLEEFQYTSVITVDPLSFHATTLDL